MNKAKLAYSCLKINQKMRTGFVITLFIAQFSFFMVNGQKKRATSKIVVHYEMHTTYNQSTPKYEATLFVNDSFSLFQYHSTGKKNISKKKEKSYDGSKTEIIIPDTTTYKILIEKRQNMLYKLSGGLGDNKKYYIKESIPELNWKLGKVKKEIQGISCHSASVDFRGRHYKVWYAPSIPSNSGPWKLNGLPGLILEGHDAYNEVIFIAKKIEFTKEKFSVAINDSYDVLSIKENIIRQKADLSDFKSKLQSRLGGRDSNVKVEVNEVKAIELNFNDIEEE